MTETRLSEPQKPTSLFPRRLGPARARTVGASVSDEEKTEIEAALHAKGYKSASEGARTVLLDWARRQKAKAA